MANIKSIADIADKVISDSVKKNIDRDNYILATYPTTDFVSHKNQVGYVGNKKGFATTKNDSGTFTYTLGVTEMSTGDRLHVMVHSKSSDDTSAVLSKRGRLFLNVPIAFKFGDLATVKALSDKLSKQPTTTSNELWYNKNITKSGGVLDFSALETYENDASYFETCLLREDISILEGVVHRITENLYVRPSSIKVHDYNASILAITTANDLEDELYVSLNYVVHIDGVLGTSPNDVGNVSTGKTTRLMYSVPVVMKFTVNKDTIQTGTQYLTCDQWTFPFRHYLDANSVRNAGTAQWNLNAVMSNVLKFGVTDVLIPYDCGSLCDITYKDDQVISVCSRTISGTNHENDFMMHLYASNCFLSPTAEGFVYAYSLEQARYQMTSPDSITIESSENTDIIWAAVEHHSLFPSRLIHGAPFSMISLLHIEYTGTGTSKFTQREKADMYNGTNPSLVISPNDNSYFSYVTANRMYITKIPSAYSSDVASWDRCYFENFPEKDGVELITDFRSTHEYSYGEINRPYNYNVVAKTATSNLAVTNNLNNRVISRWVTIDRVVGGEDQLDVTVYFQYNNGTLNVNNFAYVNNEKSTPSRDVLFSVSNSGVADNVSMIASLTRGGDPKSLRISRVLERSVFALGTPTVEYWSDPLFGSGFWRESEDWAQTQDINIIVTLNNCSGIFSRAPVIDSSSFDPNLTPKETPQSPGGVAIDTSITPNLDFAYGGNRDNFNTYVSTTRLGYWATVQNHFKVRCRDVNGRNLLANSTESSEYWDNIFPKVWHYDQTGEFNLYLFLKLKPTFDDLGRPFTDPDFVLSGVILEVEAKDRYGSVLDTYSGTIDIDPPNATGYINSDVYKTTGDITFDIYRDSVPNSNTYTILKDVVKHTSNLIEETDESSQPVDYNDENNDTPSDIIYTNGILDRGGSAYISYTPLLYGVKPSRVGSDVGLESKAVSYCKGHKYSLDDVKIYLGRGGVYPDGDIHDKFNATREPFTYIDVDNSDMEVKVTVDVNHEGWPLTYPRNSYAESNVYPCISGIYLWVAQGLELTNILYTQGAREEFVPVPGDTTLSYPNDRTVTYPNVKDSYSRYGKGFWQNPPSSNLYATGLYLAGSDASLTAQDITLAIPQEGRYRIFLDVEDEFGQFSSWCVSNPSYYYKYPFEGLNG